MKKTTILALLVVVILAGSSYYYLLGTPTYSLYQTKKAIKDHDSIGFNKYVDAERVTDSLITEATKDLKQDSDNELGGLFAGLTETLITSMKDTIKNSINESIEDISKGNSEKITSLKIKEVKKEGRSATVIVENTNEETLELSMIQTPERYWRVVSLSLEDFKKIKPVSLSNSDAEDNTKQVNETTVKFGERVSIGEGWYITVQTPELYTSKDSFSQPKAGNRFVAISIEYANDSEQAGKVDPSNLTIRDKDNQVYKNTTWGGKEPALDYDETVPTKDKIKGYVNFEVPENSEIVKAVYSNSRATITIE